MSKCNRTASPRATRSMSQRITSVACIALAAPLSHCSGYDDPSDPTAGEERDEPTRNAGADAEPEAAVIEDTDRTHTDLGSESTGLVSCDRPYETGRHELEFDVAGTMRRLILYVPSSYDGETPLPLVFNLHPTTTNPEFQLIYTGMEELADERGFFIAAIAAIDGVWNVPDDPELPSEAEFAKTVLDFASESLCLDTARVYATGFSGGARTSSLFACALPERIRAIAPVGGLRHDPPCDVSGTSVLSVHGTSDDTNFYDGCAVDDTDCNRDGEWVEGVESALSDWVSANGCADAPATTVMAPDVERRSWSTCTSGADVEFYRVEGGAHEWPLLENTTQVVVDFLLSH